MAKFKPRKYPFELVDKLLRQADAGYPIEELCALHNVPYATFHNWQRRKQVLEKRGVYEDVVKEDQLKQTRLEKENEDLRRLVIAQALEILFLKDTIAKMPTEERETKRPYRKTKPVRQQQLSEQQPVLVESVT